MAIVGGIEKKEVELLVDSVRISFQKALFLPPWINDTWEDTLNRSAISGTVGTKTVKSTVSDVGQGATKELRLRNRRHVIAAAPPKSTTKPGAKNFSVWSVIVAIIKKPCSSGIGGYF